MNMKLNTTRIIVGSLVLLFVLISMGSCVSMQKLRYLNNIDEIREPIVNPREPKLIKPFDKISIKIISLDEKASELFKSEGLSQAAYVVDNSGDIDYPFIGRLNVNGLTLEQASRKLEGALSEFTTSADVSMDFTENSFSILGEAQKQGTFTFSKDLLTIYEALALAGGITQYGDRKNLILIRQEGYKIMYYKLNLTDFRIAEKEFYYIQPNDILIVEPMGFARWYNLNIGYFSLVISSLSTVLILYTYIFGLKR